MGCHIGKVLSPREEVTVGNYRLLKLKKIGEGIEGCIWKCREVHTGKHYALKEVALRVEVVVEMYEKEVRLLVTLPSFRRGSAKKASTVASRCWPRPPSPTPRPAGWAA
jgi:hypothetical protein